MMRVKYPQPANGSDFEILCLRLMQAERQNPFLQLYGVSGQPQYGRDIIDITDPSWAAQCKLRTKGITKKEIAEEIGKAQKKAFATPLRHFTILTTGDRSTEIQDAIIEINEEQKRLGLFVVEQLTWDDLELLLHKHPAVLKELYGLDNAAAPPPTSEPKAFATVPPPEPQAVVCASCFLSYAKSDEEFAFKLHDDLETAGVRCWMDAFDLRGGKLWRPQIILAINEYARLLLVCSRHAIEQNEVVEQIVSAMERERETKEHKLFPIRLDDFILSSEALDFADEQLETDRWPEDWIRYVRAHYIPDFSHWQQPDPYANALANLLRDLTPDTD